MPTNDQKIATCLWFDGQAEAAIDFYSAVFKENLQRGDILRWGDGGPGVKGSVLTAGFYLFGQEFVCLNGGPQFRFNESVSLYIKCKDQAEVDYYWQKLGEGGKESMCGWIQDKFGFWWQVVPESMLKMLTSKDQKKIDSAMKAMMTMRKLDKAKLEAAYQAG
ncbi:VOC family protein [Paraflavitalea pollutisoli]|uniref:VOC family protein n=1 Tax=Paraflavitalea pollutisoli TaxID=3034143 RepID=UPI0023EDE5B9|nr:VOC family protein [Paraflavitalea sp. H1-2-19X]